MRSVSEGIGCIISKGLQSQEVFTFFGIFNFAMKRSNKSKEKSYLAVSLAIEGVHRVGLEVLQQALRAAKLDLAVGALQVTVL